MTGCFLLRGVLVNEVWAELEGTAALALVVGRCADCHQDSGPGRSRSGSGCPCWTGKPRNRRQIRQNPESACAKRQLKAASACDLRRVLPDDKSDPRPPGHRVISCPARSGGRSAGRSRRTRPGRARRSQGQQQCRLPAHSSLPPIRAGPLFAASYFQPLCRGSRPGRRRIRGLSRACSCENVS